MTRPPGLAGPLAAGGSLLLVVFVFAPITVYLFNATEVTVPVTAVLDHAVPLALVAAAFLLLLVLVVGAPRRGPLGVALLGLAILLTLQGNVLVTGYGNFDGKDIAWHEYGLRHGLEAAVWLVVAGTMVLRRQALARHLVFGALAVLAINTAFLTEHLARGRDFTHARPTSVDDRLYAFSPEQNVLLIVMDAFATDAFARLLDETPDLAGQLDGFTWYRDALAVAPTTLPSVPALLSGQVADNSQPVRSFLRDSFAASLPVVLQDHGFMTHTVTEPIYAEHLQGVPMTGHVSFLETGPANRRLQDALRIWNVALFRYAPGPLKPLVHADGAWLLRAEPKAAAAMPYALEAPHRVPSPGQQATWLIWRSLLDHATADADRPTFKFLHFFTTHTPYFVDADCNQLTDSEYGRIAKPDHVAAQSACALEQVLALLDRLADLEVLDETTVVLAGDHGSHIDLRGARSDPDWTDLPDPNLSRPLLLVKAAGARGELAVSDAPVSLRDVPAAIAGTVDLAGLFPGPGLAGAAADTARVRTYMHYVWEHGYWWEEFLPPVTRYEVRGPAHDPASWSTGVALPAGGR